MAAVDGDGGVGVATVKHRRAGFSLTTDTDMAGPKAAGDGVGAVWQIS